VRDRKTQKNLSDVYLLLFFIQHTTEHHKLSVYEFRFQLIAHTIWRFEFGRKQHRRAHLFFLAFGV